MSARRMAFAMLALALQAGCGKGDRPPAGIQGDPVRGRLALTQYACHSCHVVPGVTGPETYVGRSLEGLGKRKTIVGGLPNTQDNLVRWIRDPHAVDAYSAMPNMGVTQRDAIDISAYLLSQ